MILYAVDDSSEVQRSVTRAIHFQTPDCSAAEGANVVHDGVSRHLEQLHGWGMGAVNILQYSRTTYLSCFGNDVLCYIVLPPFEALMWSQVPGALLNESGGP